uniref:Uncharacterized protein n=1 Tax=Grammatophora oceanica TaxID=210454 RepID=A0A7S1Y6T1_9STRA|mmetsp:Transcript_268/g.346  ORF Transcript_268/g.346 Transcript_268/m.346 type:complete len:319 (+) Transcript_268:87-1043(+)
MAEPDEEHSSGGEAKNNKKTKSNPPLEDIKYFTVSCCLRSLQGKWNALDRDGEFMESLAPNGHERQEYLNDMNQIIQKGTCSYQNPFGGDDRESFGNEFEKLTKAEQKAFRQIAILCKRENRRMSVNHLNAVLLAVKPEAPYFVSLHPDTDESDANGTERFPFASVEQAEGALLNRSCSTCEVLLLKCASTCVTKKCHRCNVMVCTTHGGGGTYGTLYRDGDVLWEFSKCMECKKVFGCSKHRLPECDVCRNTSNGEGALGMCEFPGQFDICRECAERCDRMVEDHYDEDRDGTRCGFRCCPEHFNSHACGDDPSDYI